MADEGSRSRSGESKAETERTCLARLWEMDRALTEMEPQLPDDMRSLGAAARARVGAWLGKLAGGRADLAELSAAMSELTGMMDALTARLLLVPWDAPKRGPS